MNCTKIVAQWHSVDSTCPPSPILLVPRMNGGTLVCMEDRSIILHRCQAINIKPVTRYVRMFCISVTPHTSMYRNHPKPLKQATSIIVSDTNRSLILFKPCVFYVWRWQHELTPLTMNMFPRVQRLTLVTTGTTEGIAMELVVVDMSTNCVITEVGWFHSASSPNPARFPDRMRVPEGPK